MPVGFIRAVKLHQSVAQSNDPLREGGNFVFVRHHDDRFARFIEFHKQVENLFRCFRIEITGRFVCQHKERVIHQAARDCSALLLTT